MPQQTHLENSIEALRAAGELRHFLHPDYEYYKPEWDLIRDCLAGERRIKEMGELYLPMLGTDFGTEYDTYLDRAVYVNMTGRTLNALVSTVFRRPLKVESIKKEDLQNVTLQGLSLNLYAKKLAYEVAGLGRVGVLLDMPEDGGKPYLTEYVAENILSWRTEIIEGREVLTYVLLREIIDDSVLLTDQFIDLDDANAVDYTLSAEYRVLLLEDGVYKQRLYRPNKRESANPTFTGATYEEVIPTRNGKPLDFIPMVIMGPLSPTPEVQKSPLYDIAVLNIAHYKTSAQLEHGRYNTALPVYYVNIPSTGEQGEYLIGPSVVWELPLDSKAGILEYFGTGLKSLQDGAVEKEEYIASLGGRTSGIRPQAQTDSPETFQRKQESELSILLNITDSMSEGLTDIMRWYMWWHRKTESIDEDIRVRLNQDFKLASGARELRALVLLHQANLLPLDSVFKVLQESDWLDAEMTLEEFRTLLEDLEYSFPNQPDVSAHAEGYADAKDRLKDQMSERDLRAQERQKQMEREHATRIEERRMRQQAQNSPSNQMFSSGRRQQQFDQQRKPAPQQENEE